MGPRTRTEQHLEQHTRTKSLLMELLQALHSKLRKELPVEALLLKELHRTQLKELHRTLLTELVNRA